MIAAAISVAILSFATAFVTLLPTHGFWVALLAAPLASSVFTLGFLLIARKQA